MTCVAVRSRLVPAISKLDFTRNQARGHSCFNLVFLNYNVQRVKPLHHLTNMSSRDRKRSARTMGGGDRGDDDLETHILAFKDSVLDHADQIRQNSSAWCSRLSVKCAMDSNVLARVDVVVEQLGALRGADVEAERKSAKKSRPEKYTVSQKSVLLARVIARAFSWLQCLPLRSALPGRVAPLCEGRSCPHCPRSAARLGAARGA